MSVFLYNIFLLLFKGGTRVASVFNPKARKWVKGRKDIFNRLRQAIPAGEKIIWIHCASLGEFEQGRPVMERLKKEYPAYKILLTFFSPSGFEALKNHKGADWIFYLPMDGPLNAKKFLEIVAPKLVIFVKYEFWHYYLKKIFYRKIPLILISAIFRKNMSKFKWFGGLQKKMLSRFNMLFVQDNTSKKLLDDFGLADITSIAGDTRFDRVLEIAMTSESLPLVEQFIANRKVIIAGSTWPEDVMVIHKAWALLNDQELGLIIAPHEIDNKNIQNLRELFPGSHLYSELSNIKYSVSSIQHPVSNILIIDNIGILSRLYKYASLAFVGGGFVNSGIHNVLEPAVYGKPVVWGPVYEKYDEAIVLIKEGGGFVIKNEVELAGHWKKFLTEATEYSRAANAASKYVKENAGATRIILNYIQEKRLLTN